MIWDLDTLSNVKTLFGHNNSVTALASLTDGSLASGSADKTIKIWVKFLD